MQTAWVMSSSKLFSFMPFTHFFQSVVDFGIVWHAYWHSSTWENHQNSQIQTLIPIMTRAQFKHRATLIMMVPVHSTFNILFISRFHVNPKLTAKILSSRCAVMSSLALPPCWSWKMLHLIGTHTMSLPSPSPAQLWGRKMVSTYCWSRSSGSMIYKLYDNETYFWWRSCGRAW